MNFLAFRQQLYDWTLESDEALFEEVNKLTDQIFETHQTITSNIQSTKVNLTQSSSALSSNFNNYLKLSESKFTQNKIADSKPQEPQNAKVEEEPLEAKSKLDIYKEALNISIMNLDVKEEEVEKDNVSISDMSVSQAIFKNTRLPPYFGSKEFKAQKFLNLFYDEDLMESVFEKNSLENLSNEPLSMPSQEVPNNNSNILPPPPPLSTAINATQQNLPPPPPPISNLPSAPSSKASLPLPPPPPPPPLTIKPPPLEGNKASASSNRQPTLPPPPTSNPVNPTNSQSETTRISIEDDDPNKALLDSIMQATKMSPVREEKESEESGSLIVASNEPEQTQPELSIEVGISDKKPLSFQEELALKLKHGKNYKPDPVVRGLPQEQIQTQSIAEVQNNSNPSSMQRQSIKVQDILKGNEKNTTPLPKTNTRHSRVPQQQQEQEEEENSIFAGGSKRRSMTANLSQMGLGFGSNAKKQDDIMSRNTFNDDMLFKKKPVFDIANKVTAKNIKQTQKQSPVKKKSETVNALFAKDDSDEEEFSFKRKSKKQQRKPQVSAKEQKPATEELEIKRERQVSAPNVLKSSVAKKSKNKLFQNSDSDEEDSLFSKPKGSFKKKTEATVIQSKPQSVKKQAVKAETPQKKKTNALFGNDDDDEDDFSFKPKNKQTVKTNNVEKQKQKPKAAEETIKKTNNPLFDTIAEEQGSEGSRKNSENYSQSIQVPKQEDTEQKVSPEELQRQKKIKKIAAMGGQGMPMLVPKGMGIQKSSDIKNKDHIVDEKIQENASTEDFTKSKPQQRSLDPLQNLIKQTVLKRQEPLTDRKQQTKPLTHQKRQDPLEKLIQRQIISQRKESSQTDKSSEDHSNMAAIQVKQTETGLSTRRKKKPRAKQSDEIFDQEDSLKTVVVSQIATTEPKSSSARLNQNQKSSERGIAQSDESSHDNTNKSHMAQKMAMMGAGMGMMPVMPKGLIITKPSEAKKMEKEALERQKEQKQKEEHQKLLTEKMDRERQQRERQLQRQQALQQQRILKQEEQRKKLNFEREEKQRQKRKAQEAKFKKQQQEEQVRIKEEQRKGNEEQNNKPQLPSIAISQKPPSSKPESIKNNPLGIPKMPAKVNPLGIPKMPAKTNPLGGQPKASATKGPLGSSNTSHKAPLGSGPISMPTKPAINSNLPASNVPKPLSKKPAKSLFDDDEQESTVFAAKKSNLPMTQEAPPRKSNLGSKSGKKSLFDDDEDDGFSFDSKAKTKNPTKQSPPLPSNNSKGKPSLFGENQQTEQKPQPPLNTKKEQVGIQSKKQRTLKGLFESDSDEEPLGKPQDKSKAMPQKSQEKFTPKQQQLTFSSKPLPSDPQRQNPIQQKKSAKSNKKGLFDQSDDDEELTKPKPKAVIQKPMAPKAELKNIEHKKPKAKKGLFDESDSDEDSNFLKKPATKQSQKPEPMIPSSTVEKKDQKNQKKKQNLFGSSSEDDSSAPKQPLSKQETKQQSLKTPDRNSAEEEVDSKLEAKVQVEEPKTNNRRLFDSSGSDSDDEEMMKKRRAATRKLKGVF